MQNGHRFMADSCGLCGGTDREVLATRGRGHQPLTTALCRSCGLVSHHPLPSVADMAAFYAKDYRVAYKGGFEPKRKHSLRAVRGAISRAGRLMPFLHGGARILDIGASSGEFVYVMARSGFDARGIEPNEAYADFARRSYGVAMQTGGFEQAAPAEASLNLVTMNHVLEHVADPWQALRRIHAWLAEEAAHRTAWRSSGVLLCGDLGSQGGLGSGLVYRHPNPVQHILLSQVFVGNGDLAISP
jgi:hypothetical protein